MGDPEKCRRPINGAAAPGLGGTDEHGYADLEGMAYQGDAPPGAQGDFAARRRVALSSFMHVALKLVGDIDLLKPVARL